MAFFNRVAKNILYLTKDNMMYDVSTVWDIIRNGCEPTIVLS